jgi:hypothetical protein
MAGKAGISPATMGEHMANHGGPLAGEDGRRTVGNRGPAAGRDGRGHGR